jgi:hypothetical protein
MYKPGGSVTKEAQEKIKKISKFYNQVALKEIYTFMGSLTNADMVQVSLGLASNFEDAWRLICWHEGCWMRRRGRG